MEVGANIFDDSDEDTDSDTTSTDDTEKGDEDDNNYWPCQSIDSPDYIDSSDSTNTTCSILENDDDDEKKEWIHLKPFRVRGLAKVYEEQKIDVYDDEDKVWRIGYIEWYSRRTSVINVRFDGWSKEYGFRRRLKNKITVHVAALHTHSPLHFYEVTKSKAQTCRKTDCIKLCYKCQRRCCESCNLRKMAKNVYACSECINSVHPQIIYNALQSVADCLIPHILQIITSYSLGFVFECCNEGCTQSIAMENMFNFKHKQDSDGNAISRYFVEPKYLNDRHVVHHKTQMFRGKMLIIFCSQCTQNAIKCPSLRGWFGNNACKNGKVIRNNADSQEMILCLNHPECGICHRFPIAHEPFKCSRCNKVYCTDCGIQQSKFFKKQPFCIECLTFINYRKLKRCIFPFFNDVQIINLIVLYSMGLIIKCSNKECNKDIHVNNWIEFEQNMDSEGKKFHNYHVAKCHAEIYYFDSLHFINGHFWRTFCAECRKNKLKKCTYHTEYAHNHRCSNFDLTDCCKNHYFCGRRDRFWQFVRDTPHQTNPCKCQWIESFDDYHWNPNTETGDFAYCRKCGRNHPNYFGPSDPMDEWNENINVEPREYRESRDNYRQKGHLYGDYRFKQKNKNFDKKAIERTKKRQKKKQFMKREKDKRGRYESNKEFKKQSRQILSLEY